MSRDLIAATAVASVLAGVVFVVAPSIGMQTPVPNIPIGVLGGVGILFALLAATSRRNLKREAAEFPLVETRQTASRPGVAFDASFDRMKSRRVGQSRREIRHRLHEDAVDVLTTIEGLSEEAAEDQLASGEWTDDPHAAALFGAETPSPPLREAVRQFFADESTFERRVRHVVYELRDRTGKT